MSLRRLRFEAALLSALCVGLGGLLLVGQDDVTSTESSERRDNVLPAFRHHDITRLSFKFPNEGEAPLVLVRDPEDPDLHHFSVVDEISGESQSADPAVVAELLRTLEFARFERMAAPTADSFTAPGLLITVAMGRLSYELRFGAPAPKPEGSLYLSVTDGHGPQTTGVVAASLKDKLTPDRREFLGRLLFPHGKTKTRSLVLASDSQRIELIQDELGFRLGQKGPRADRELADRIFYRLASSTVDVYLEPGALTTGQTPAPLEVSQVPAEGETSVARVFGPCPGHPALTVVQRIQPRPLIGCTQSSAWGGMMTTEASLTSKALTPLHMDEVDHVVVQWGDDKTDLRRDGSGFELDSPRQMHIDLTTGNDFLRAIIQGVGELTESGQAPASSGDKSAGGTLTVFGHSPTRDREVQLTVSLSQTPSGRLLAERQDDGRILLLPRQSSWLLAKESNWFEPLILTDIPEADIQGLRFQRPGASVEEISIGSDGTLSFSDGLPGDQALIRSVLASLRRLSATQWLAPPAGDEAERLAITLIYRVDHADPTAQKTSQTTLRLFGRTHGGFRARMDGKSGWFLLPAEFVRAVDRPLGDRSPGAIDPSALVELEAITPELSRSYRRTAEGLTPVDGEPMDAESLELALRGLMPEARILGEAPEVSAELILKLTSQEGTSQTFRYGKSGVFQGLPVVLMTIDGEAGGYWIARAALQSLLDQL